MAGLKETFSKGLTTLNVKTSGFMEENKIRTYISTLNARIDSNKKILGEKIYEKWKEDEGELSFSDFEELMREIKAAEDEIEVQEAKIVELRSEQNQILGANTAEAIPEGAIFCPNCGNPMSPNFKFCNKCGTPLG